MTRHKDLISKTYNDIIKSEEDKKLYRGLELSNQMKVLLVSDSSTDKSAASINVHIGSMSEPRDLPGLAHFCEHMLFLGTEKYPLENDYNKFLHEHGGSSNAYTAGDQTCYYFNVSPEYLSDALDRFAQFFLCPLFTESATEREINAVDSEHDKNLKQDSWRLNQLEKATCNPLHDYSKFGTGNLETLSVSPKSRGISIRDELLKFHGEFYSANAMSLVVYGKESLDELEDIVVPLFSMVINKNIEIPEWKEHPFDKDHLQMRGYVVPVKDIRNLRITFPFPDLTSEYHSNPGYYLSHLIGHEGPNSLLSELKLRGWANSLVAGPKPPCRGFSFFYLDTSLTEEGLEHYMDIVTLLFQYIKMLKQEGSQKWIFEECKTIKEITFRFKDGEKPETYATSLAERLVNYPMKEVLTGPYLLKEYRPDLIDTLLQMLSPNSMRIAVIGKKFQDICIDSEKWYGTQYKLEKIEADKLEIWNSVEVHPNFKLPAPNEFIPSNLTVLPEDHNSSKTPLLIKNTKFGRLWYKKDDQFGLPKAALNFEIESPLTYVDPLHYNICRLYTLLVKDSLTEYTYMCDLAGLAYNLHCTKLGIFLSISGYNDKQHVLLHKILDNLTNFKINEKRFKILKSEMHRLLSNFKAEQPHQHARYFSSVLLSERVWTNEELLSCINEITIENMKQTMAEVFSKIHIEALIHGNLTKEKAMSLMELVEETLRKNASSAFLMPSQLIRERELQLTDGCHYVYEVVNEVHRSSAIETYYQCGIQDTRLNMLLELLVEIIAEPCYDFLRTQEQLGYIVWSGIRRSSSAQGLKIIVQSEKPPVYIDGKIESFLQYFEKKLQDMNEDDFQQHKQTLASIRLEKPKTLMQQCTKFWVEIMSRHYNFDRDSSELAFLETITKEELCTFFKELIACDAPKRKKLSTHVSSSTCINSADEEIFLITEEELLVKDPFQYQIEEQITTNDGLIPPPPAFCPPLKIENVIEFKNSLGLYPLPQSCIPIPSPFTEKAKL